VCEAFNQSLELRIAKLACQVDRSAGVLELHSTRKCWSKWGRGDGPGL